MALIKVKSASVYYNNKKAGTFENNDLEVTTGDTPQYGDPGGVGFSDGAVTTMLTLGGINPLLGGDFGLIAQAALNKEDLVVSLWPIDGATWTITMRVESFGAKSSHRSGTQASSIKLSGFDPSIT